MEQMEADNNGREKTCTIDTHATGVAARSRRKKMFYGIDKSMTGTVSHPHRMN